MNNKWLVLPFVVAMLMVANLCADALQSISNERVAYAAELIKIQLSPEAISRSQLPTGLYAEASSFGINELDQLLSTKGGTSIIRAHRKVKDQAWADKTGWDNWFLVRLDGRSSVEEAIVSFKQNRYVLEAIPEYLAYTTAIPNDTYYPNQWGHNNTSQLPVFQNGSHSGPGVGTPGFDGRLQSAWDDAQGYGDPNIIIAIIDTGVDTAHEDLRLMAGYDYGDNDSNPMDDSAERGHGTACAGVAAARADNGIGIAGVAGGCTLMPLKVADSAGDMYLTAIDNAITHAADNGARVISMSLGVTAAVQGDIPNTDAAITYAYNAGVILFAATANDNASTISYPANHQYVVSVGAASPTGQRKSTTSSDGEFWWGSNYGVNIQDDKDAVDIMAPTILPATAIGGTNYQMYFNGTSCATPFAAGVAALVLSRDPSLTPADLRGVLTSTATDMTFDGGVGWDRYTGYGLVNAYAALQSLEPSQPFVSITAPSNGSLYDLGTSIGVTATAIDNNGSIVSVDFYVDDVLKFTDNIAPYSWNWDTSSSSVGTHVIKAVATDNDNNAAEHSISIRLKTGALQEVIIGTGTSEHTYPMDRYYNYSTHEAIYLNTEIGEAGAISSIAYYKASGEDTNPIVATRIYMKHSSETNLSTGDYSLDGYTLVYSGAFPNTASSGWMEVNLSNCFDYNGVSNLSILIIKGYQASISSDYPLWRYSTSSPNRARHNHNDTTPPTSLSTTPRLPNLRLKIYPVPIYNPPQNLSAISGNQTVTLSWQAPDVSLPTSYKIYRNGAYLTSVISELTYQDNAVINGNEYSYYIVAKYDGIDSVPSNTVNATPNVVAILGTGTGSTGGAASPIIVNFKSLHGQSVYTKAELNVVGIYGPIYITQVGFNVASVPSLNLPNFIVRMKHTTAINVSSWQDATDMQTVYNNSSYLPKTGWDMLPLSSPFLWNGNDNIVVDTAFGLLGSIGSGGSVYYTASTNGYRYARSNDTDRTNEFSEGTVAGFRPNLKLFFESVSPPPELTVPFVDGFETSADNWILANSNQTNKWHWGTATPNTGTHSLYISDDDGASNSYDVAQASISHFYTDIDFPSGTQDFYLRFNWKANGQDAANDYLQVYLTEPATIPSAGTELTTGALITGALSNSSTWQNHSLQLPANLSGSTKRLVFSWKNNGSLGIQPPAAIDNIRIVAAEQQDIALVIGTESEIDLPPVSGPNSTTINASLIIDGVSGSTVDYESGYKSVESPFTNAGLDIRLSAESFTEPYLMIEHNLGFIPPTIAYRMGSGDWTIVADSGDWDESMADLSISTNKQRANELTIVFSDSQDGTLPVTLSSFTALFTAHGYVRVDWATASETGVMGYHILRSDGNDLSAAETISALIPAANAADGAFYTFRDQDLPSAGTYYYWLSNLDFNGNEGFYGPLAVHIEQLGGDPQTIAPTVTQALGNYPNPFNPFTNLRYALAKASEVNVQIYNSRGQLVRTLSRQHTQPGYFSIIFDGKDASGRELGSGVYLYRLEIGEYSATNRILLLK